MTARVLERKALEPLVVAIGVAVDTVDVVAAVEGMRLIAIGRKLLCPALEEHDRYVYAVGASGLDPRPHPVEVRLIEL